MLKERCRHDAGMLQEFYKTNAEINIMKESYKNDAGYLDNNAKHMLERSKKATEIMPACCEFIQ